MLKVLAVKLRAPAVPLFSRVAPPVSVTAGVTLLVPISNGAIGRAARTGVNERACGRSAAHGDETGGSGGGGADGTRASLTLPMVLIESVPLRMRVAPV